MTAWLGGAQVFRLAQGESTRCVSRATCSITIHPMAHRARKLVFRFGSLLVGLWVNATPLEASNPCVPMPSTQVAAVISDQPQAQDRLGIASLNTAGDPRTADRLALWALERAFDSSSPRGLWPSPARRADQPVVTSLTRTRLALAVQPMGDGLSQHVIIPLVNRTDQMLSSTSNSSHDPQPYATGHPPGFETCHAAECAPVGAGSPDRTRRRNEKRRGGR
jgi:hypothetical protein